MTYGIVDPLERDPSRRAVSSHKDKYGNVMLYNTLPSFIITHHPVLPPPPKVPAAIF